MTKRELKAEVVRLTYRVADLEERLCPCDDHDWKCIKTDWDVGHGVGDVETYYTYKCRRCGKTQRTWEPFLERVKERKEEAV